MINAAWGAGLDGCDSDKVLSAIVTASELFCGPSAQN